MLGNKLINTNAGGGCTNTVDLYNPFPDGGGLALYQLNGNATDVSGNYDGTATNVTYGTGVFGQAGVFNGTSSYINLGGSIISANSSFSISHWVKFDNVSTTSGDRSIHIGNSGDPSGISIFVFNSILYLRIVDSTNTLHDITYSPSNNVWYNLVITYDNSTKQFKGYVDNVLIGTKTISAFTPLGNYGAIGSRIGSGGANQFLQGSIDQVRIFNRALRPYEVEALYTEEYCTPTIVPSEHFNTVLYTGNAGTNAITGVGFAPDFVWAKVRNYAYNHWIYDTVRGANAGLLPNLTVAENTTPGVLTSLDSDGFTLGSNGELNANNASYVSWSFKAGGAAVTNTDGTITSQVSANTEAGFSVVSYTGTETISTIGHGLNGEPKMIIVKRRENTNDNWYVYNSNLSGINNYLQLNTTAAELTFSPSIWGGSSPTSTVFSVGTDPSTNSLNEKMIAYCFAEVEGFSSIGSYVGNGGVNTIVTGFEPAFMLFRAVDIAFPWELVDNKRPDGELNANNSDAERIENTPDFLENGFRLTTERYNNAGQKFIYMAFAADPTTVEPTLEDSFNTVLYTGNSGTPQTVTGMGFQPDMVWQKQRTGAAAHRIVDSIRGSGNYLYPNLTNANDGYNADYMRLASDGVYLPGADSNYATNNYVVWGWKGAELPAINSNGSIPSVVSANPAAGFSISTYNGKTGGGTTGHGLNSEPEFIIFKRYTAAQNWFVFAKINNVWNIFEGLNTTAAATDYSPYFSANDSIINWYNANEYDSDPASSYLAYSFHSVAGFSKFGSYTGVIASGNPINVGFEPAFILVKRYNATENWVIFDNKRGSNFLMADSSAAEILASSNAPVFTATGFYFNGVSTGWNSSGNSYIYMAFANQF